MIGHSWRAGTIFFLSSLLCVSPLLGQTARAAALDADWNNLAVTVDIPESSRTAVSRR